MNPDYKFIGWENGWSAETEPKEHIKCRDENHRPTTVSTESCEHTVTCDECKIIWKYDSGD